VATIIGRIDDERNARVCLARVMEFGLASLHKIAHSQSKKVSVAYLLQHRKPLCNIGHSGLLERVSAAFGVLSGRQRVQELEAILHIARARITDLSLML
jgi:hypothetical protein